MKDAIKRMLHPFDATETEIDASEHIDIEIDDLDTDNSPDTGQIAVDVFEIEDGLIIIAPLAGVTQSDLDVNLVRNVLTISGHRNKPDIYDSIIEMHVNECFYGAFSRSIILPENLGLNHIRATIERGMLIITIPHLVIDSKSIKVENLESTS